MENEDLTTENVIPPRTSVATPGSVSERAIMKEAFLLSGAILVGSLIIAGAILALATKEQPSLGGKVAAAPQAAAPGEPVDVNVIVTIDDDPILGDRKKAKVAIVEFTDYECPFCKRFHAETFDTLVKDYVDTGKAIIVTRDFPLSFHDPIATDAAALAECVRKEKGDKAYFAFSKAYYENTVANGKGLPAGKADELIAKAGANVKKVTACAATDAVKAEIAKDLSDGSSIGISGTPSFVVGTIDDEGIVTGERVVGALQTSDFKAKIEQYLSK